MDNVSPAIHESSGNWYSDQPSYSGGATKQAACLSCRKSKTKCVKDASDLVCKRCHQAQTECVVPDYRVGRKKGIKNKRDGLDKAVHQIEQALKKSRTDRQSSLQLQHLLNEAQNLLPQEHVSHSPNHVHKSPSQSSKRVLSVTQVHQATPEDNLAVDDVENPLQLLARASDLSSLEPSWSSHTPSALTLTSLQGLDPSRDVHDFFGPFRPKLDVGEHLDPIDLGLVTIEESDMLFTFFHENLSHTRWGLDSLLHTRSFVRQRSAFLFTSILAASSLFLPSAAALAKRLLSHCKVLVRHIIANRNRSPEIVLGFMVSIPWMQPGTHWSDDETCSYMSMALTIAIDIYLNKWIVPSPSDSMRTTRDVPQGEVISARKALDLDGFEDIEPSSTMGRRLLRRRERTWIALFVLDRGVCLARGRNFTVPLNTLIMTCDEWHKSDIADGWDGSLISSTVFRRDLTDLITQVKADCDKDSGVNVTSVNIQEMIDNFFTLWYATWACAIGGINGISIPPYVEILVTHGRLSIYGAVINHPTAPVEVKQFFRAAGLSSALNVMRAAVQGESRLKSMPNNTVIMISYSAMISSRLSTMDTDTTNNLAPSVRRLIDETAEVLIRIGTTPSHRKGTSALYGRHLQQVISTSDERGRTLQPSVSNQVDVMKSLQYTPPRPSQEAMIQFSAMSDEQIYQAINGVGDGMINDLLDFPMEGNDGLDWLDWFNMYATNTVV